MAEKAEAPSAEKESAPSPAPQKPILLIIVAIVNMAVMGSVVGILYTSHKKEMAKPKIEDVLAGQNEGEHGAAAGHGGEGGHGAEATSEHGGGHGGAPGGEHKADTNEFIGKLIPLETFLVNLANTRGGKLIKVDMELEVDPGKVEEEIEKRKPQIRDIIIFLLGSKTYDQVITREGKEMLRDEVRDTINGFLVKGKIKKVYFTNFIVN